MALHYQLNKAKRLYQLWRSLFWAAPDFVPTIVRDFSSLVPIIDDPQESLELARELKDRVHRKEGASFYYVELSQVEAQLRGDSSQFTNIIEEVLDEQEELEKSKKQDPLAKAETLSALAISKLNANQTNEGMVYFQ